MIDYRRIDGESEDEFIYRICSAKDQIGSWDDVANILNKALGYNYGESKYRKTYQSFDRMFSANRSKFVDNSVLDEMEKSRIELEKERWRLSDVCREYSRLIREQAREDHWEEIIRDAVGRLEPRNYSAIRMSDKPHTGKDLLVSLCDIHYGTDIDNYWGKYNSSVCRAYLKNYLKQIIEIGESRGAENCYVWMNGDAISGNIHTGIRISNKENLMQQVMEVSELISWFLDELSLCFNHVYFLSVSGNHSRVDKKEDSVPSERLDDIVPWFIDARCANNNRVEVMKDARIDPTMWVCDIRGKRYVGVHGDYDNGVSA